MSLLIKHGVGTGRTCLHLGQLAQGLPFIVVLAGPWLQSRRLSGQATRQGKPAGFSKVLEPQGSISALL